MQIHVPIMILELLFDYVWIRNLDCMTKSILKRLGDEQVYVLWFHFRRSRHLSSKSVYEILRMVLDKYIGANWRAYKYQTILCYI